MSIIRLGTRGSPLALWQAHHVRDLLNASHPNIKVELVLIDTTGDVVRDRALSQIGGDGLFTKEIQVALLENRIDIAVHSLKDLPTAPVAGLHLAAVPKRGSTGDAFVSNTVNSFDELPKGAVLGTTSLRRRSQALYRRPDLQLVHLRGNVETRLKKIELEKLDGIILAEAGLVRLGFASRIREILDTSWMLSAVGQGALGLECRQEDSTTVSILASLNDHATHQQVLAERHFLQTLGGGCLVPVGVQTTVHGNELQLRGVVLSLDGKKRIEATSTGNGSNPQKVGEQLAASLKEQGADEILAEIRPGK